MLKSVEENKQITSKLRILSQRIIEICVERKGRDFVELRSPEKGVQVYQTLRRCLLL